MPRTAADYAAATVALMPRGRAWVAAEPGLDQAAVVGALAVLWATVDASAENLLENSLPGANTDLLPEWEATLGLTDSIAGLTTQQRSSQVLARFVGTGGQSKPYFIAFAAALGFTIAITTYAPFRAGISTAIDPVYTDDWSFSWGVSVSANASGLANSVLIDQLQTMAPAETAVFIA
ncbi:MAG: DUF2313 domain-containing protein [Methylovirgula sp.]|nr:DUF2313 domain-containing protein [Methylovirgula sp.]